jgi:hypothetical protein
VNENVDGNDCDTNAATTQTEIEQARDQAEYYKLRLDHTLQHTQQATRLVYLANGGVLAALYFMAEKLSNNPYAHWVEFALCEHSQGEKSYSKGLVGHEQTLRYSPPRPSSRAARRIASCSH